MIMNEIADTAPKRQRCNHDESMDDNVITTTNGTKKLSACCLPVQLHLREIGYYSRRRQPPKRCQNYLHCQWIDRMLKTAKVGGSPASNNDNDDDLGCFITTYPTTTRVRTATRMVTNTSSQWNALQYSAPTYYNNTAIEATNNHHHASLKDDDDDDLVASSSSPTSSSSIGIKNGSSNNNNNNNSSINNTNQLLHTIQTWRPYTRRSIPFSKLCTPYSDAILALDRWGGYLIGVGSGSGGCGGRIDNGEDTMTQPYLSIKFYGIPSPARLHQHQLLIQNQDSCVRNTTTTTTTTISRQGIILSPLIHTVPLLFKKHSQSDNDSPSCINIGQQQQQQYNEYASPVAEIPMQFLFCDNGSLGIAFLCHSSTTNVWTNGGTTSTTLESNSSSVGQVVNDEDNYGSNILGTIVIFEPPKRRRTRNNVNNNSDSDSTSSKMTKSFRLCNVTIAGWKSFTLRNALWPTTVIPTKKIGSWEDDSHYLCQHFHRAFSAYVLFNDEDDGFRLTWVTIGAIDEYEEIFDIQSFTCTSNKIHPTRHDIIATPSEGFGWQECLTDSETGYPAPTPNNNMCNATEQLDGVNVAYEVYLHIDALLSDIICRRRQSSLFKNTPYHKKSVFFIPNFYYNLISASMDTLKVLLIVTFSNKEILMMHNTTKSKALGVFVEVNLFDQSYTEVQWVQHPSCVDSLSMKQWCDLLAVNWRMKQCRVGVFCLDSSDIGPHLANWCCNTHECNVDQDMADDCNVKLWKRYVEEKNNGCKKKKKNITPPKDVSMSSLYPYCDVITNQAVQNSIPVKRITSRKSPIELTYG